MLASPHAAVVVSSFLFQTWALLCLPSWSSVASFTASQHQLLSCALGLLFLYSQTDWWYFPFLLYITCFSSEKCLILCICSFLESRDYSLRKTWSTYCWLMIINVQVRKLVGHFCWYLCGFLFYSLNFILFISCLFRNCCSYGFPFVVLGYILGEQACYQLSCILSFLLF